MLLVSFVEHVNLLITLFSFHLLLLGGKKEPLIIGLFHGSRHGLSLFKNLFLAYLIDLFSGIRSTRYKRVEKNNQIFFKKNKTKDKQSISSENLFTSMQREQGIYFTFTYIPLQSSMEHATPYGTFSFRLCSIFQDSTGKL